MYEQTAEVLERLRWMREERIWPNGLRYLWTDAFGVVLLTSLYQTLGERHFLEEAEWVVAEVERVLGRSKGLRIGEAPERDGQYFHYLAMWMFALARLGEEVPAYRERAIRLARDIHPHFVIPDVGVVWKMKEDLSGPSPGHGLGALDAFHGLVVYRQLDEGALAAEIAQLEALVEQSFRSLRIGQDLGLGMMLWMCHLAEEEEWARVQRALCLGQLDRLWVDPPGYFCRGPGLQHAKYAFTNYGVCLGLRAVGEWEDRVEKALRFFSFWRSGDEYDRDAITHVMRCCALFPSGFIGTGVSSVLGRQEAGWGG
jgi:hypothetical protein